MIRGKHKPHIYYGHISQRWIVAYEGNWQEWQFIRAMDFIAQRNAKEHKL